ncbi:hypothetical protein EDM56_25700 [Brevibacillus fluminis]|uniref:Uncharacterized protein n=1 Tax=Brevibacillus fluminis TaxID=511487 RepID=A0A3M8CZ99_9BACL|nr:hypothetical protein [Brevibacillus fluminis]RNB81124.1 hypothetical protein EDM56_25700 [Brevibacillus fluminis]
MSIVMISILSQIVLSLYVTVTHLVSLFPWNDLSAEKHPLERPLLFVWNGCQAIAICGFWADIIWMKLFAVAFWTVWMCGNVASWWLPYWFGATSWQWEEYRKEFGRTYKFSFLRDRGTPVPDAMHTVITFLSMMTLVTTWLAYLS